MKRPQHPNSSYRRLAGWLAGGVLLAASVLVAESPQVEPAPAAATPASAGLRVYIDPDTGELTSTPSPRQVEALSKSLEPTLSRSSVGLEPFELSLGGRGLYLEGRFQSALVVRLDGSGGFELSCVDDPGYVEAILELHDLVPVAPLRPSPQGTQQWEEK